MAKKKKAMPKGKRFLKELPLIALIMAILVVIAVLAWAFMGNFSDDGWPGNGNSNPPPPRAMITMDKDNMYENDTVHLSGKESKGDVVQYLWDFGDGDEGNGPTVTHTYREAGKFTIRLTVIDSASEGHMDVAYLHVHHVETVSSTVSMGQTREYVIPVKDWCQGSALALSYPSGAIIGGNPTNDLDIEVYRPNGTLYLSSDEQEPDDGNIQVEELNVPIQEIAIGEYKNWKVRVTADSGINVKFDLEIEVNY